MIHEINPDIFTPQLINYNIKNINIESNTIQPELIISFIE